MSKNTTEDAEQMRRELVHSHLPELAERGYVRWDPETETIRQGEKFDELVSVFESMDGLND